METTTEVRDLRQEAIDTAEMLERWSAFAESVQRLIPAVTVTTNELRKLAELLRELKDEIA